jgi:RNA polymerase sigma-70 factor, ECF subfamily
MAMEVFVGESKTDPSRAETTILLKKSAAGDKEARDALFERLYPMLREIAERRFRKERVDHTLQATALVHEAYLKLVEDDGIECRDRNHFLHLVGRAMWQILVDHARCHRIRVEIPADAASPLQDGVDALDLDEALGELEGLDHRQAAVVELRFFSGLTMAEAGETLGIADKTVEDDWYAARAWLRKRLKDKRDRTTPEAPGKGP